MCGVIFKHASLFLFLVVMLRVSCIPASPANRNIPTQPPRHVNTDELFFKFSLKNKSLSWTDPTWSFMFNDKATNLEEHKPRTVFTPDVTSENSAPTTGVTSSQIASQNKISVTGNDSETHAASLVNEGTSTPAKTNSESNPFLLFSNQDKRAPSDKEEKIRAKEDTLRSHPQIQNSDSLLHSYGKSSYPSHIKTTFLTSEQGFSSLQHDQSTNSLAKLSNEEDSDEKGNKNILESSTQILPLSQNTQNNVDIGSVTHADVSSESNIIIHKPENSAEQNNVTFEIPGSDPMEPTTNQVEEWEREVEKLTDGREGLSVDSLTHENVSSKSNIAIKLPENSNQQNNVTTAPPENDPMEQITNQLMKEWEKAVEYSKHHADFHDGVSKVPHSKDIFWSKGMIVVTFVVCVGLVCLIITIVMCVYCKRPLKGLTEKDRELTTLNTDGNRVDLQILRPSKTNIDAFIFGLPISTVEETLKSVEVNPSMENNIVVAPPEFKY